MLYRALQVAACAGLLVVSSETMAHAYLDAGNGSMIVQLLVGGFAGLGMYIKLTWRKWRARWQKPQSPDSSRPQQP